MVKLWTAAIHDDIFFSIAVDRFEEEASRMHTIFKKIE
jgi:hypothetical protein